MFCFNCGAQLADNSRFCGVCGATLSGGSQGGQQPAGQGGYFAPVPPVQGAPVSPFQDGAVPPVHDQPGAPFPGGADRFNAGAAPQSDNSFGQPGMPFGDPNAAGSGVSFGGGQQGIFQGQPADNAYQFSNNAAPGEPNLFQNGQQMNYGMPMGGVPQEPAPMVYSQPAAPKPKKPVKKMKLSVSVVLAVVLGLFSFIFGMYAFVGGIVRNGIASGELSSGIRKTEIGKIVVGDILTRDGMADIVEKNGLVLPDKRPEKATIAQIAALTVNENLPNADLTEDKINQIIDKADISKELSRLVKSYEEYILTGDTREFSDGLCEEIKQVIVRSERYVIGIAGMKLAPDYEEQLDKVLDSESDAIEGILPEEALSGVSGVLGFVLSPVVLVAALVLSVLLILLVWLITKRVPAAFIAGGAAYTVIGALLIVASVFASNLTMFSAIDYTVVEKLLTPLVYNAFGMSMLYSGLITLGAGVILVALFIVFKVLQKKRAGTAPASAD